LEGIHSSKFKWQSVEFKLKIFILQFLIVEIDDCCMWDFVPFYFSQITLISQMKYFCVICEICENLNFQVSNTRVSNSQIKIKKEERPYPSGFTLRTNPEPEIWNLKLATRK